MAKQIFPSSEKAGHRPLGPPPAPGGDPGWSPILGLAGKEELEHRQFPRAAIEVRFQAWIGDEGEPRFTAFWPSVNLSVSGAFLESTFFLPVGTELWVRFQISEEEPEVVARAQIVRHEQPDRRTGEGRSGFGLRFLEFVGQTEVGLAKLFVGQRLRDFALEYLQSERARSLLSEQERMVDVLAAWELRKVTTPDDLWQPR